MEIQKSDLQILWWEEKEGLQHNIAPCRCHQSFLGEKGKFGLFAAETRNLQMDTLADRAITLQMNEENVQWQSGSELFCPVFYSNSFTLHSSSQMVSFLLLIGVLWLRVCQCEWVETDIQDGTHYLHTIP